MTDQKRDFPVSDMKSLFWIILALGAVATIWWLGWFDLITQEYLIVKRFVTYR